MKVCGTCKISKPLSEYYRRADRSGYRSACKDCVNRVSSDRQRNLRSKKRRTTTEERFWKKVTKAASGCWNWDGAKIKFGYGSFRAGYKQDGRNHNVLAHRFSYQIHKGTVPAGLVLDHLCRNTSCVNPDHLEPVTQKENIDRGFSPSSILVRKS